MHRCCCFYDRTIKGFVTLAKEKNSNVKWTHCIIHKEALASKRMSPQLHDVLNCSIMVINFIKSQPHNSRLFRLLCKKIEANIHNCCYTRKCTGFPEEELRTGSLNYALKLASFARNTTLLIVNYLKMSVGSRSCATLQKFSISSMN